jgi:ABC-2 type transport system ATP-binding protein
MQSLSSSPARQPLSNGALAVSNLSKSFKSNVVLSGISFTIQPGELFGVVGPDGAGKSTLFNMLAGIMPPSSGTIETNPSRSVIGYVTQRFSFSEDLSVRENINYAASLQRLDPGSIAARADELLQQVNLHKFQDRLAGQLSGGMKQKLALCCAIVTKPQILLLDEPSTGLDPIARRELWHLFVSIAHSGVATLVATPDFVEAELCSRIAFLDQGKLLKVDTPEHLRAATPVQRLLVRSGDLDEIDNLLHARRANEPAILDVVRFGDRIDVLAEKNWDQAQLQAFLAKAGFADAEVSARKLTLENAYSFSRKQSTPPPVVEPPSFASMGKQKDSAAKGASKVSAAAIEVDKVTKQFGQFTAVHDLTLRVEKGEVFGLLGANGAGKTTTIRMLCGLTRATRGQITVSGLKPADAGKSLRSLIGYMNQQFSLYDDLSVQENIEYIVRAYGLTGGVLRDCVDWSIRALDLESVRSMATRRLSRGWKQRVALAAAIAHQPQILLLDEPTAGTDPEARRRIWRLIRQLTQLGVTVLVTTHYLEEAQFCTKIGLLVDGTLIADGTPDEIKNVSGSFGARIFCDDLETAFNVLADQMDAWRLVKLPGHLRVICSKGEELPAIRQILASAGIDATVDQSRLALEEAFIVRVQAARGLAG